MGNEGTCGRSARDTVQNVGRWRGANRDASTVAQCRGRLALSSQAFFQRGRWERPFTPSTAAVTFLGCFCRRISFRGNWRSLFGRDDSDRYLESSDRPILTDGIYRYAQISGKRFAFLGRIESQLNDVRLQRSQIDRRRFYRQTVTRNSPMRYTDGGLRRISNLNLPGNRR